MHRYYSCIYIFKMYYNNIYLVCNKVYTNNHGQNLVLTAYILGGATLIFSVELLELSKKPYFPIPMDKEFWTYIGLLGLVLLGGYEVYRRAINKDTKSPKDKETSKTRSTNKRSKKKK